MSDLDTLIVTFQTQLSDVMETVVKTAMYEVTRLVEDGFLEEVKLRRQEVESLKMQLQWTEKKLSDQGGKEGGKTGKCVDCAKKDVELSTDTAEERTKDQHEDVLRGCAVKKESNSLERWTRGHRQEVISELPQEADSPTAAHSPERESQATEEKDVMPAVDVKEEELNKPSCSSVHLGGWSSTLDGKAGLESHSATEMAEAQPKQTQENGEELLRNIIRQGPQISAAYGFPEEQEETTHMATDPSHVSSLEVVTRWTGLLQNHRLGTEKDHDPAKSRGSLKCAEHEPSDSDTADVHAEVTPGRDLISTSGPPKTRLQNSEALGVTIKQEVNVDSDGCEESEHMEKKEMPKSGMASFSCSVKHHRLSAEAHKQNHISHKATVQEVMKLHSKVGAGLRLQAAIQHLHRPMKKTPHALSNSATAALSIAHSQAVNLNPLNRTPSTSKATAPLSVQRVHLGDKQGLNRTGAPWVSIRSQHQSANSHHANPVPHPDSHTGPRHLLRCGQCGKCFPHPSNLKAHLQTHTGERPFCCSLCGRSFTKLSNLKAHRRVHTGERPYCCLACGKRFTQKCNLKRHQRIHLDV
ncbi:zinc finger protein 112 isoform X2 [Toxotes jaculatrix]|uniref:zinc finger protein 112 isoform X2 n=1 Tax=Toxotes jaculatrix TaxID=941984 RepID=UPI001B3AFD04|nr:zinc finger protein 112 isoform X2 [Toxotes jaculatrix]